MPAKAKKIVKVVAVKQPKARKVVIEKLRAPQKHKSSGALSSLGGLVGGALGGPMGGALGSLAGNVLSTITGFGDYKVNRNSVSNGNSVASFRNGGDGVRVCHREFLTDVTGSINFALTSYSINPGLFASFPWLSLIAQDFEEYEMEGLVFEYRPSSGSAVSSTSSALGVVILATDYDAVNPPFTSKQEMEAYEFSTSCVPFTAAMHPVECMKSRNVLDNLYVRRAATPAGADVRLYDLGNFQIATAGMQSAYIVGELWVTYDVRFRKPRLAHVPDLGPGYARFREGPDASAVTAHILGTVGANESSDSTLLSVVPYLTTGLLFTQPGDYLICFAMQAATSIVGPNWSTGANFNQSPQYILRDNTGYSTAVLSTDTKNWCSVGFFQVTTAGTTSANAWIPTATLTGATTFDVLVFQMNIGSAPLVDFLNSVRGSLSRPSTPFVKVAFNALQQRLTESKDDFCL